MLCGRLPFRGEAAVSPYAVALMQLTKEPPAPREVDPSISPAVEAVILQALAADPVFRPTARDLASRFAVAVTSETRRD